MLRFLQGFLLPVNVYYNPTPIKVVVTITTDSFARALGLCLEGDEQLSTPGKGERDLEEQQVVQGG